MSTNLMPDDRRSLTLRLGVVQYLVAVVFASTIGTETWRDLSA